jgi:transcriptional regulator with XRE-family HTH domain
MNKMDTFLVRLGSRINALRLERGWSPYFLAYKIDRHVDIVFAVERGVWNMSLAKINHIAKVFNIPISQLTDGLDKDL